MTEVIAYATLAYALVQLVVVLVNLASFPVLRRGRFHVKSTVSVLIPARNEAANIGDLLDDLGKMDGSVHEIIVYDDDSTDETADIVRSKQGDDPRIQYMRGEGPEIGWLGKNFACHRLAEKASGDYLLFLDADVRVQPSLLEDSFGYVEKHQLQLLSLFPVQRMGSLGEWLTVPLMNRILLGNLNLILIRLLRSPDFSAANGQFMLFKADTYKMNGFHEKVRDEKVEDIRIMRMMKKQGLKTQTLLSNGQIACRMYRGYPESVNGFSKNIVDFFGKRWLILFLYILLTVIGPAAIFFELQIEWIMAFLVFQAMAITGISVLSRQNVLLNLFLYIPQQISLLIIALKSIYGQLTGRVIWKGRKV